MVPFVCATVVYTVPLKIAIGYYSQSTNIIKDIVVGELLTQGSTHLWFLPTLFIVFSIVYPLDRYLKSKWKIVLLSLFAVSFVMTVMPVLIFRNAMYYTFWFYIGYCFENKRQDVNKGIEKYPFLLLFSMAGFFVVPLFCDLISGFLPIGTYNTVNRFFSYIQAMLGCYSVYISSYIMTMTKLTELKVFKNIRDNTLGLYLYSDTWNYVILFIATGWFGNTLFVTNIGAALFYFSRIIITFTLAFIISKVLKKLKVKYVC